MKSVTVRNLTLGTGMPKICVPVVAHTMKELTSSLDMLKRSYFDMVEFRADFYFDKETAALEAVRDAVGEKPVLYTIRTREEGGEIDIGDEEYFERNLAAAPYADLADIQLSRLAGKRPGPGGMVDRLHGAGVKVIVSWHDFEKTPKKEEIVGTMLRMQEEGCDISKAAVMPRTRKDVMELIAASIEMLERKAVCPFVTMSMGELGRLTRMAGSFTGSCITFGTAGPESAPGQISSDLLRSILLQL